jgi:LacI family transcriptional regulator
MKRPLRIAALAPLALTFGFKSFYDVSVHKQRFMSFRQSRGSCPLDKEVYVTVESAKQATLVDVAQKSGVSYQTVSRVINSHPSVAPKTRERVLVAIKELNYKPNVAARSLVTRRSRTVGIISYGTTFYGPGQMLTNIEESFRRREYSLTLSTLTKPSFSELQMAIHELKRRLVDGIVMITPILQVDFDKIRQLCANVPFVMIDIALGEQLPSVVIDQRYGGRLATHHLIELGHHRIAEISGPLDWSGAKLRHEGWLAVLHETSLEPTMSVEGDWSAASGYTAACRFSGLVVGNDQMALGAVRALHERGFGVPDDISVVGFDNLPESAFFEPPLTTVRQDFVSLGRQSAEYLADLIEQPDAPLHQRVLYPELIVRHSTRRWR